MDWFRMSARLYPDRFAIIFDDVFYTYRDIDMAVDLLCTALLADYGLLFGRSVAVFLPSNLDYVILIHALVRLGAIVVPLNTKLSASELTKQTAQCDFLLDVSTLRSKAESGFVVNDYTKKSLGKKDENLTTFDLNRPFARIFTSGTSGQPKAAELSLNAIYHSAIASVLRIGHQPTDKWLCTLPLYHVGGLSIIMRAALYGTCVILQNGFDLEAVNHALDTQGVTLASFVPTMLYRLMEARVTPPPHLRLVLLGGAAATPELVERAHAAGFPIATTYGLTEAASQVCTQLPDDTRRKPGSVGKPLPFTNLRVIDKNDSDMALGEVGEIIVNSPTLMTGYVDNPEATAKTLRDGWLYTGDLGYLDEDGDLWLVQRRSDLIISGGENVYPAEVEAALKSHPSVRDAVVVGLAHPEWGQQVAAVVVLRPGHVLITDELTTYLRTRLAGYKLPRFIKFMDALPLTASGKIERHAVQMLFFNDYAN